MGHGRPWRGLLSLGAEIAANHIGVLAGNIEMAVRAKSDTERMMQSRVVGVSLDVDVAEGVLAIWSGLTREAEHLGGVLVGVGNVEVTVGAQGEAAKLAQFEVLRQGVRRQRLAQRLAVEGEEMDV